MDDLKARILLRLARTAKAKAAPPAQPQQENQLPISGAGAVPDSLATTASGTVQSPPTWLLSTAKSKTASEKRYVAQQPKPQKDTMNFMMPSVGLPKAPDGKAAMPANWVQSALKGKSDEHGQNLMASLSDMSNDPTTEAGQLASKTSKDVYDAFKLLVPHFETAQKHLEAGHDDAKHYILHSTTPVQALLYKFRLEKEAGADPERQKFLDGAFEYYTKALTGLSKIGRRLTAVINGKTVPLSDPKEPKLPYVRNDEGLVANQTGGAADKDADAAFDDDDDSPSASAAKKRTQIAKSVNRYAMTALNEHIFRLMKGLRYEIMAKEPKGTLKQFKKAKLDELLAAEKQKAVSQLGLKGKNLDNYLKSATASISQQVEDNGEAMYKQAWDQDRQRKLLYQHFEGSVLKSANAMTMVSGSANEHLRGFSRWYSAGAHRFWSGILDLWNRSPYLNGLKNKFGRTENFDPATGQAHPQGTGTRIAFDNPDKAWGSLVLSSIMAPTSANEKPDSNVKIGNAIIEDGHYNYALRHKDNPDAFKNASALDILAHSSFDKASTGRLSEFGNQIKNKFWSGIYYKLSDADKKKYAKLFASASMAKPEGVKEDLGVYHLDDVTGQHRLLPVNPKLKGGKILATNLRELVEKSVPDPSKFDEIEELVRRLHGDDVMTQIRPKPVYTRKTDGNLSTNFSSLQTRPTSTKRYLHFLRMMHRGITESGSMDDSVPESERLQRIARAVEFMPYAESPGHPEEYALDHIAKSKDAKLDLGLDPNLPPEEQRRRHALSVARYIDKMRGQNPDKIVGTFLYHNQDLDETSKLFGGGRTHDFNVDENGNIQYHGDSDSHKVMGGGASGFGGKFYQYGRTLATPIIQALAHMGEIDPSLVKETADRVMMENASRATGRVHGGTPHSELQRAVMDHHSRTLGKDLARYFGMPHGALDVDQIQAGIWAMEQLGNSNLGGNNPTGQLYTGIEGADMDHRLAAMREMKALTARKAADPATTKRLKELEAFLDSVPLHIRSMKNGEAYAGLHDQPFLSHLGQYAGDADKVEAQKQVLENMGAAGGGIIDRLVATDRAKKLYQKRVVSHDRGRQGDHGVVQRHPAQDIRRGGEGNQPKDRRAASGQGADRSGSQHRAAAPDLPLDGRTSGAAERRVPQGSGRNHARPSSDAVRSAPGAAGRAGQARVAGKQAVLKFSSQFMRSMMLGISASAKKFSGQINDIAKQIGVPVRTYTGVGDATSNSSPATAHISGAPMDPDTARYLAAWSGLLGGKRSVMVFHPDQKGTDSLYSIRLPITNMQELRAALDRKGIQHRTIIPGEKHSHVFVYDPRRIMRPYVARLAEEHDGDVLESTGRSEFLGRPANGGSADPLADSREHYRRVIADYEEKRGIPNPAGTAANGGGGGASVSGDPAAGRSPAGGSIVRGVTYKGGKFTPAGEQKAPPAPKEGSPERFKKRKVKLNRAANIAQQGLDQTASSKVLTSPKLKSDAAANVAIAYNNSETSGSDMAGSMGKPLFNYAGRQNGSVGVAAPVGDGQQGLAHQPSDEPTKEALYSAAANANGIQSDTPVAYNSDMNAIRHMLHATARQRVTPYQRYEGAKALASDRSSRERIDKMCDSMQRLVGAASHGTNHWIKSLSQETRPINHDIELADGVTRLNGVILPYDDHHELLQHVVHREDETLPVHGLRQMLFKDRPFLRRYVPTKPVQYGLLDYLHDAPGGQPLYGTPDGNIFLDPAIANFHVNDNRGILKYHGNVFMPWHNIQDRVQRYTGVDHLIDKIANDDTLYRMEKRPQHINDAMAGSLHPNVVTELLGTMQAEPERVQRLLGLLGDNLGVQPKDMSFRSAYGTGPKTATPLGAINGRAQKLLPYSPLGVAFGGNATGVTKMADSIHRLFHHFRQNDPRAMAHVGTYVPQDEDEQGTMGYHLQSGFNPETNAPILGSEHGTMFEPESALPFSMINMSQLATPITLAHEIGHHISANIPGIERAVMEHAFANSNGGVEKKLDENGNPFFFWKNLNTQWATSKDRQGYAKRIYPGMVAYAAPWNNGPRRLNHFNGSNEYLSTMMEEFFARPVAMARKNPMTVRFLLGLMNGALRNHR